MSQSFRAEMNPDYLSSQLESLRDPAKKLKISDVPFALPKVTQQDVDRYDWEAFDYAQGISQTVAEQCLAKLASFQDLFSSVNIASIPADKYADIATILPTLMSIPSTPEHQDEYLGRLGQLAEILGNQDIVHCIDAVKSYNYDVQMAASQPAAAQNGGGTNESPSSTALVPLDATHVAPISPPLWVKLTRPWYSKVLLVSLLGGASWYGYSVYSRNKKKEDEPDFGIDVDLDLEEDEDELASLQDSLNPFSEILSNPKKKRSKRKKKVRIKGKKR